MPGELEGVRILLYNSPVIFGASLLIEWLKDAGAEVITVSYPLACSKSNLVLCAPKDVLRLKNFDPVVVTPNEDKMGILGSFRVIKLEVLERSTFIKALIEVMKK